MNTFMWDNPFTEQHIAVCKNLGMTLIDPVAKKLACGDVGVGGMASFEDIASVCREQCIKAGLLQ